MTVLPTLPTVAAAATDSDAAAPTFVLTPEWPEDDAAIEALLDAAFGAGRLSKTSYRYRDGVAPLAGLSLVARDGERLVGSIRYWPLRIGQKGTPALLLGPLAIAPDRQGTGIGRALMGATMEMAARAGHRLVLLVGDLPYYARFGFAPAEPLGLTMPGEKPGRLLYRALTPDALDGVSGPLRPWTETAPADAPLREPPPTRLALASGEEEAVQPPADKPMEAAGRPA